MKSHRRVILLIALTCVYGMFMASDGLSADSGAGGKDIDSVEERRLKASIEEKREELAAREAALRQREIELKTLAVEVDKKLDELQRTGEKMQALFDQIDAEEQQRLRKLSAMYEKMEPFQAAEILVDLEEKLAIKILAGMKGKSGGRILANMDRDTAARLTREFPQVISKL